MVSIVLIGLPASGKTTVGQALAQALSVSFVDTDHLVERRTGKLIREIFADEGEERFRQLEEEAARDALAGEGVVSLGGGAIMNPAISKMVEPHQVVWLDVSVTTLTRRAGMNQLRPLLLGDIRAQLSTLAEQRLPVYEQAATWRVDAEQPVDKIVSEILQHVSPPGEKATSPVIPPTSVTPPAPVILPPDVILPQAGSPTASQPDPAPRTIDVHADHSYTVLIGRAVSSRAAQLLTGASRTAILHPPVLATQAARIAQTLTNPLLIEVPQGEQAKTPDQLVRCWRGLAQAGITRSDAVIGLGGGSTTDLAGFVAATMLRGIAYLSIPTTVLGMADAAVGGKTGVNLPEGKNLVGAFYEPQAVLCDLDLLTGLPRDEIRSGLAEILKCGFIADPAILDVAERTPSNLLDTGSDEFADVLTRAISVKAEVVSADLRESSVTGAGREALNYGHTLGHAIEKVEGFTWAHGYAVSVGMVFAAEVACALGLIGEDVVALHRQVLSCVGLPISYSGAPWTQIREAMSLDKKARGTHLRLVLLDGIGHVRVVPDVSEDVLRQSFLSIGGAG